MPGAGARGRGGTPPTPRPGPVPPPSPGQFSGGRRQRIAIARAVARKPRLIICDEPTSALDVTTQAAALSLLSELQDTLGRACLFITHDLAVVKEFAARTLALQHGRIVEEGPSVDVATGPGTRTPDGWWRPPPSPTPTPTRPPTRPAAAAVGGVGDGVSAGSGPVSQSSSGSWSNQSKCTVPAVANRPMTRPVKPPATSVDR
ncbi:ATP-binding cassette domain-containing protein [Streptomyces bottropensis]|uniref:ATP-binding cassette domain-containing protein n=1 Tax=Streptomyces bottropensis TaxID=42235 RepID=UPI00368DE306